MMVKNTYYAFNRPIKNPPITKKTVLFFLLPLLLLPVKLLATDAMYCPQKHAYIKIGMTSSQVINACGEPSERQGDETHPIVQRIPVKQLIYTTINSGSVYPGLNGAFYNQWSLPSGSTGISLEINVINDKVSSVTLNGTDTHAISLCGNNSIQKGDDINQVYNACGSPSTINTSYIDKPLPSSAKAEIWTYRINPYQPLIHLTFIAGQLESIN